MDFFSTGCKLCKDDNTVLKYALPQEGRVHLKGLWGEELGWWISHSTAIKSVLAYLLLEEMNWHNSFNWLK